MRMRLPIGSSWSSRSWSSGEDGLGDGAQVGVLPIQQAERVTGVEDIDDHAAQVALAWVLSRGDGVVPLAGSSRPAHVENSAAAVDLVLTEADLARIDEVVPAEGAHGARYPEPAMRLIDAG